MTEASLNVLHGVSFPQSRLWAGAAARFASDSGQALMSQEETGALEEKPELSPGESQFGKPPWGAFAFTLHTDVR